MDNNKGFVTTFKIEFIGTCGGKPVYRLLEPLIFNDGERIITVPEGFETNLASVPRVPVA